LHDRLEAGQRALCDLWPADLNGCLGQVGDLPFRHHRFMTSFLVSAQIEQCERLFGPAGAESPQPARPRQDYDVCSGGRRRRGARELLEFVQPALGRGEQRETVHRAAQVQSKPHVLREVDRFRKIRARSLPASGEKLAEPQPDQVAR
jgi:hypothetical protein